MLKIGVDVEGEAVHRHPALDRQADGGDLAFGDPDTGMFWIPESCDLVALIQQIDKTCSRLWTKRRMSRPWLRRSINM